jgi:hypothetical protein
MAAGFGLTADLTLAPVALRTPSEVAAPLGLPPLPTAPADAAAIALGKKLFFDRRPSLHLESVRDLGGNGGQEPET